MKVICVIPARHGSTRFPGKPLANIVGKPMIQHVVERVQTAKQVDRVVVATDHEIICNRVQQFGGEALLTSTKHESGSDRMAEVATRIDGDFFINIQGDEPLIRPELIDELIEIAKQNETSVITAKVKLKEELDILNSNVVKVVTDKKENALYFSRSPIPYNRTDLNMEYYKHIGIYCFPKKLLKHFVNLPKSSLETTEMLEQLRLLDNGVNIKVVPTTYDAVGVDTPEDIIKVEKIMEAQHG